MNKSILLILGILLVGIAIAYVAPDQENVVLTLTKGYTAPNQNNVILVLERVGGNVTGDTCDTVNWDCTEECTVDSLNAGGNKITATGVGTIRITSQITNCLSGGVYLVSKDGCKIINEMGVDICE